MYYAVNITTGEIIDENFWTYYDAVAYLNDNVENPEDYRIRSW